MTFRFDRITSFLKKKGEEPFYFASHRRLIVEYTIIVILGIITLFTAYWQEYEARFRRNCSPPWVNPVLTMFAVYAVHMPVLFIAQKLRFHNIFLCKKLDLSFERPEADGDEGSSIPYSRHHLLPTVRALRATIEQVKDGEKPLLTVTSFLRSENGKAFLKRALRTLHRVKLLDGNLVRICHRNAYYFILITEMCLHISVASVYRDSRNDCDPIKILMGVLNNFSITLLAILALAAFGGIGEYAQLISVSVKKVPLSEDEKFLISLLAANSNEPFFGIARSECSGYTNILNPGKEEVLLPMHMSFFAFKEAKTVGIGSVRHYMEEEEDCVGNYDMI